MKAGGSAYAAAGRSAPLVRLGAAPPLRGCVLLLRQGGTGTSAVGSSDGQYSEKEAWGKG